MERLTYVNIAGKNYPMSFSLQAMRLLAKKAGTVEKAVDKIQSKEMTEEAITMIGDVLEL